MTCDNNDPPQQKDEPNAQDALFYLDPFPSYDAAGTDRRAPWQPDSQLSSELAPNVASASHNDQLREETSLSHFEGTRESSNPVMNTVMYNVAASSSFQDRSDRHSSYALPEPSFCADNDSISTGDVLFYFDSSPSPRMVVDSRTAQHTEPCASTHSPVAPLSSDTSSTTGNDVQRDQEVLYHWISSDDEDEMDLDTRRSNSETGSNCHQEEEYQLISSDEDDAMDDLHAFPFSHEAGSNCDQEEEYQLISSDEEVVSNNLPFTDPFSKPSLGLPDLEESSLLNDVQWAPQADSIRKLARIMRQCQRQIVVNVCKYYAGT